MHLLLFYFDNVACLEEEEDTAPHIRQKQLLSDSTLRGKRHKSLLVFMKLV